jgi:hypothetical protein
LAFAARDHFGPSDDGLTFGGSNEIDFEFAGDNLNPKHAAAREGHGGVGQREQHATVNEAKVLRERLCDWGVELGFAGFGRDQFHAERLHEWLLRNHLPSNLEEVAHAGSCRADFCRADS